MPPPPPKKGVSSAKAVTPKPATIPESNNGTVTIEKGVTKNLGDYNSARIAVSITLPIDYTPEHLDAAKRTIVVINEVIDEEIENQVAMIEDAGPKTTGKK
jgi:hypothetical protein